ncbi:hypothetical protein [Bacteroides fragilis]|uniref:hypothetical protein n=1 Tax=Bacteroides fragilis TaxID=817 RepID=UPI0022AB4272|nr:hypothetical protein [Bacteroides fragilis]MCZ2661543.1 hypothetical protein [Bacteroides fragilis]
MEEYKENIVAVKLADNSEFELTINIMEDDLFTMSVSLDDHLYEVQEEDIFPTFQKLRDMLLLNGIGLKCCGAMINAHQSGMMSTSDKVYILTLGKLALRKDISMIFNYTDIREFPNTSEQKEFAQKWLKSLQEEI